jgi:thiamine biosynthesis lipoprotein
LDLSNGLKKCRLKKPIEEAKARVGSHLIEIKKSDSAFKLRKLANSYIDLSSLAKGFGVDQVSSVLAKHGMNGYLVDIGGEIKLTGLKPDASQWEIAVVSPDSILGNTVYESFSVSNIAMATSGDYRNYFEENGVRYSHMINPKTAKPITHHLASVSVLDKSSMRSDALATCLLVKGDKAGFEWAEKHKIAAYFIAKENGKLVSKMTSEFKLITGA